MHSGQKTIIYLLVLVCVAEEASHHRLNTILFRLFASLELLWVGCSFPLVVSNRGYIQYEKRGKYEIGFILGWFLWFLDCKILFNISR